MELDDLLSADSVLYIERVTDKLALLTHLVEQAASGTGMPADRLLEAVLERENLGSTGLGNGIAVPHGKVAGLKRVTAVFARLGTPVEFDAVDDQPVDLVMMLLAPVGAGADHLKALSRVARMLRTEAVVDALRATDDPRRLFTILNTPIAAQDAA